MTVAVGKEQQGERGASSSSSTPPNTQKWKRMEWEKKKSFLCDDDDSLVPLSHTAAESCPINHRAVVSSSNRTTVGSMNQLFLTLHYTTPGVPFLVCPPPHLLRM